MHQTKKPFVTRLRNTPVASTSHSITFGVKHMSSILPCKLQLSIWMWNLHCTKSITSLTTLRHHLNMRHSRQRQSAKPHTSGRKSTARKSALDMVETMLRWKSTINYVVAHAMIAPSTSEEGPPQWSPTSGKCCRSRCSASNPSRQSHRWLRARIIPQCGPTLNGIVPLYNKILDKVHTIIGDKARLTAPLPTYLPHWPIVPLVFWLHKIRSPSHAWWNWQIRSCRSITTSPRRCTWSLLWWIQPWSLRTTKKTWGPHHMDAD